MNDDVMRPHSEHFWWGGQSWPSTAFDQEEALRKITAELRTRFDNDTVARIERAEFRAAAAETIAKHSMRTAHELSKEVEGLSRKVSDLQSHIALLTKKSAIVGSETEAKFNELSQKWYNECVFMSFLDAKFAHPAYRAIIDMGPDVIPYVLRDIDRTHGHWGCALMELTGANPVRKADAGYVDRIAKTWVRWGKTNGFSW